MRNYNSLLCKVAITLVFVLSLSTANSTQTEALEEAYVAHKTLEIRESADESAAIIGEVKSDEPFTMEHVEDNGWIEIENNEGTSGYVHSSMIVERYLESIEREVVETMIVRSEEVVVYSQPYESAEEIGSFPHGEEVNIYDQKWSPWFVTDLNGQLAFVHEDALILKSESENQEEENEGSVDEEQVEESQQIEEEAEVPDDSQLQPQSADGLEPRSIGIVTHRNLAIRESASGSSQRVGNATEGDALEILETVGEGPWVSIRYNGDIAYTHSNYFVELEVAGEDEPVIGTGTVTHRALAIRSHPSGSAARVGTLTEGAQVEVHEYVNNGPWFSFTFDGGIAYTHRDYVDIEDITPPPEPPEDGELGEVIATGIVDANGRLAVRTEPSGSSESLGHLVSGDIVLIYEYINGGPWVKIEYEGQVAYTHADYMNVTEMGDVIDTATVTHHRLSVRSGPGASYETVHRLTTGDQVEILQFVNGGPWVEVNFNGGSGFTHLDHLRLHAGNTGPLQGRLIVVDAGHGGHDPGAQGNGLVEKTLNLQVSLELAQRLESSGAEVILTRSTDTFIDLSVRANIANQADADLFISVHGNAAEDARARGAETFHHPSANPASVRLANVMQDRLVSDTGMTYRRVDSANFAVLRETTMPATLIELGFLTNSGDASIMRQPGYPARAGEALHQGFLDYYS
ncbi:SH3 domain-containing protein [Geomicrobium sp. JCM 19038]|uniref:SH3 domain-containing protein n=1 Tax=Geomicrobium sp. JCM 19038 TaxID=1460635 RepID=UPI00045F1E20|nr:SH3 domain-containing protein [Geomicrobium sp. JCM 19038]GAK08081.1 N-acetylmuramoyl-L-alanine amidase [Geomicrobium sp. JCM 19038]